MHDTQEPLRERALLVGLERSGHDRWAVEDSLLELRELAETAGAEVIETIRQKRNTPSAPTFIGSGKAAELADRCRDTGGNMVIFDDDLTPAQGRNLGEILGPTVKVLDRTELILDIFAQRARTREGQIQVELAQLQYMLPRLTGLWTHLSRQRGGVGSRGPGEQQLEVDRRRVMEKISRLTRDLEEVRKNRRIERGGRQRLHWPRVSIIGYTNSGKSTLLNLLTGANVLAEDKLFATLDPTTRKLRLPNNQNILLSDTVGFLRKLPHHLIESFQATLEEVAEADLLLHVVDVSHPQAHDQIQAVEQVLHQINAWGKPTIIALNKIDRLEHAGPPSAALEPGPTLETLPPPAAADERRADRHADAPKTNAPDAGPTGGTDQPAAGLVLEKFRREFHEAVPIAAATGANVDQLLDEIANRLRDWRVNVRLAIPHDRARTIGLVYQSGHVTSRSLQDDCVVLEAQIPKLLAGELSPFVIEAEEE